VKIAGEGHNAAVSCQAADCRSKVRSLGQQVAAICAALPTDNAGQYSALNFSVSL